MSTSSETNKNTDSDVATDTHSRSSSSRKSLSWSNLSYEVNVSRKNVRQLLRNVSGTVYGGEMVAIMGSSGAGKTTLLNCLSGRLSTGNISGSVLYNGLPRDPHSWKRTMAFVEQEDIMHSQLTVRETLQTAARLRLPSLGFSKDEKLQRADEVLKILRLSKAADTRIGDGVNRGVSGGEKKRTAIGQELVGNPDILFLDEPTSGLDSNSALAVMENVRNEAIASGRIVVSTIHQPSFELLSLFDKVILLSGGSTVYQGAPNDALRHFKALGFEPRANQNPADFFLDVLTIDTGKGEGEARRDRERIAMFHEEFARVEAVARNDKAAVVVKSLDGAVAVEDDPAFDASPFRWSNDWFTEFRILFGRCWLGVTRDMGFVIANLMRITVLVILIGFTFFRLKTDQNGIQNRLGILFFWPVNQAFSTVMPVMSIFPLERAIMLRERAAGSYRTSSFFVAKALCEVILATGFTLLAVVPLYFMMGLRTDDASYFIVFAVIQVAEVLAFLGIAFLIGSAVGDIKLAQVLGPLVTVTLTLYGGVLVNNSNLNGFFMAYQHLSPINYAFRGNMINEFDGLALSCSDQPCFTEGRQVLDRYSLFNYSKYTNVGALFGLVAGYMVLAYTVLRFVGRPKTKLV